MKVGLMGAVPQVIHPKRGGKLGCYCQLAQDGGTKVKVSQVLRGRMFNE